MNLYFKQALSIEVEKALEYLKIAATNLKNKNVDQWSIWLNPSDEKIQWVKDGFSKQEFYFVENDYNQSIGMFRLLKEDELYWGKQTVNARYIHSLIVLPEFSGLKIGNYIMKQVEQTIKNENITIFRLDCNAANTWLCNYYKSLGFIEAGQVQMPHSLNTLFEKRI